MINKDINMSRVNCKRKYFITGKRIDLAKSKLIYETEFDDLNGWEKIGNADWQTESRGLLGSYKGKGLHGQIFLEKEFSGDVIMEFDTCTVLPSNHDIIWWWHTEIRGGKWGKGYLGCLEGWWSGKAGIEKLPEGQLFGATPLFGFELGKMYHVVSGSIGGRCFIAVDGKLVFELLDPDPFPAGHKGRIGFGIYQASVRYEKLKAYVPYWEKHCESYGE